MLRWWYWGALALTIIGLSLALAAPPPASFKTTIGTPNDTRFVRGVNAPEHNEDGPFRWTNGAADVRFTGFEAAGTLAIALRATPPQRSTPTPLEVTFSVDHLPPLHVSAAPAWRTYHFWMPRSTQGWAIPTVGIQSDPVRASEYDDRKVGLALSTIEVVQAAGMAPLAILQRGIFFLMLLALPGCIGARTIGRNFALTLLPLLTGGLAFGSWNAPLAVPFWFPQLWNVTGFGIAAVVAPPLIRWLARWPVGMRWSLVPGLTAALCGTTLLSLRLFIPVGFVLLIGGSIMSAASPLWNTQTIQGKFVVPALIGIIAVATLVRFYHLGSLPFGLWRDEARFGILAQRILADPTFRPIYVPAGVDYPALLFYLTALVIETIGVRTESVRVVAALAGSLAPLSLYFLGRRVVGAPVALVAAALMACAAWHISLSRISFVAVLDPLFTLAGLALLWSALDSLHEGRMSRASLCFGLSGCVLGIALYTYHTARVIPLLIAFVSAVVLGRSMVRWRRAVPGLLLTIGMLILVALPLVWYAVNQGDRFNLRMSQTSVLRVAPELAMSTPAVLDMNLHKYLMMWHLYGDPNGRHYAPDRPMLDIVTGAAAMIGLWLTLRRMGRVDVFLFGWFLVEFVPPLVSEGAPHAVRSVGMIAPAMLLAGRGLVALGAIWSQQPWVPISCSVIAAASLNLHLYFGIMPYDPHVWRRFNAPETMIATYLRHHADAGPFAVPRRIAAHDVVNYLAPHVPLQIFNRDAPPTPFRSGTQVLVPEDAPAEERLRVEQATGGTVTAMPMYPYPGTDRPTFWRYDVP